MKNGAECYSRFLSGDKNAIEEIILVITDDLFDRIFIS